jgi:cell division protein FtsI (penicillin-binding protein 3)
MAKPDTNYYCEKGQLFLDGHMISEAESKRTYEWLSVEEILAYSSNIGTTKIAFDLTYPKLKATLDDIRIGEKTGVEIPSESRGILTSDKNISPLSLSNISFGQGVATTGIQMLAAYAPFVNDGYYIEPTILLDEKKKPKKKRVFSHETVQEVNRMLIKAVEDGTGSNARVKNFVIAGKTSTAQRVSPEGGYEGYVPGFLGYPLNVKKPFIIYVYIDNPEGYRHYGNSLAAPVFQKVAEYILYKNKEFDHLINIPRELGQNSSIDRVRTVQAAARLDTRGKAPNFIGLDKISAQKLAKRAGVKIGHDGIGVVVEQRPSPGDDIERDTIVRLEYNPPTYE